MRRPSVDDPILLDFLVRLLFAFALDFQLFARFVQHVLQPLADGRLARLTPGVLTKLRIAVSVQLMNRSLTVAACVFLHDRFQTLPRVIATFWRRRLVLVF